MSPNHESSGKYDAILSAARGHFLERGFAAARIADIARDAGVGKGTVYEYFNSKEHLLIQACMSACKENEKAIVDAATAARENHPVRRVYDTLVAVLTVYLCRSTEENHLFFELSTLAHNNAEVNALVQQEFRARLENWRGHAREDYEIGRDAGYFRDVENMDDLAQFIVATVNGLIWETTWQEPEDVAGQAHRMAKLYYQLLLREPERFEEFIQ